MCLKLNDGTLSASDHAAGIKIFSQFASNVLPTPGGDITLINRAYQISAGYGCSRSADAIYIALAEELAQSGPTTLLTFDRGVQSQAKIHAPGVVVHLL